MFREKDYSFDKDFFGFFVLFFLCFPFFGPLIFLIERDCDPILVVSEFTNKVWYSADVAYDNHSPFS